MYRINKIIQGISILLGIWVVCSYAAIQKETIQPTSTFDHFFTNVEAGVNGGYITGLSTVYGGINGNVTLFQQGAYFSEIPMNFVFGNSGFFSLSGGITGGYNLNTKTLLRAYGIFDAKQIQGGLNYPEGIIGIEGYEIVPWGIQDTGAIHASSTFSLPLTSLKSKTQKEDYFINILEKSINQNVTYSKIYSYQDIRVGYLPGYYGIEVYAEPYIIYPTNDQIIKDVNSGVVFGYGGGIEDVVYFLGVKITSQIGVRNDSLTGFNMGIRFGVSKMWINRDKIGYKHRFSTANQYSNRPLPYSLGGISVLNKKGIQPLDKELFNYDVATNNDEFHNELDGLESGHIKVLILTAGDYTLDKDLNLKDKAIICSSYYCAFTLKNGDYVVINKGKATIKKGVGVEQNTRAHITLGNNNILQVSSLAQMQGIEFVHSNALDFMELDVGTGGGFFINNNIPTRLLLSNAGSDKTTIVMNDNTFGGLKVQNFRKNTTFAIQWENNLLTGENADTGQQHISNNKFTYDGLVYITTYKDGDNSVTSGASIRFTGTKNRIKTSKGLQNESLITTIGDVAMGNKNDALFDDITVDGDILTGYGARALVPPGPGVHEDIDMFPVIQFLATSKGSDGLKIGNITVTGKILIKKDGTGIEDGDFLHFGEPYQLGSKKYNPVISSPLTLGDVTLNQLNCFLCVVMQDPALNAPTLRTSSIKIGNVKVKKVINMFAFGQTDSRNASITIGNIDVTDTVQHFILFTPINNNEYIPQGNITMGNIVIKQLYYNNVNGMGVGQTVVKFIVLLGDNIKNLKGVWTFGDITIKGLTGGMDWLGGTNLSLILFQNLNIESTGKLIFGNFDFPNSNAYYHGWRGSIFNTIIRFYFPTAQVVGIDGLVQIGSVTTNAGIGQIMILDDAKVGGGGKIIFGSGTGLVSNIPLFGRPAGNPDGYTNNNHINIVINTNAGTVAKFGGTDYSYTTLKAHYTGNWATRFRWTNN